MKLFLKPKTWKRLGLSLGAIGGLALICGLGLVDYSPYMRQQYCAETVERLHVLNRSNSVVTGKLRAGFGKALLTPMIGARADEPTTGKFRAVPLAGFGSRKGKPATGVHDQLYVKAMALRVSPGVDGTVSATAPVPERVGVFVGADALIIPPEVAELAMSQVRHRFDLAREQVYFGATHTHAGLGGWGEGFVAESFAGPFTPGVREWFAAQIISAIGSALADLKPAAIGHGFVSAQEFLRNRLVGNLGEVDPELSFLFVQQEQGTTGIIGSYGAHATAVSSRNMEFSADYPGYWQAAIEEATGGCAIFLAGGVGSHSPNPPAPSFEGARQMGTSLARLVLRQMSAVAVTNVVTFGIRGLPVSLPSLHARITDQVRLRPWLARKLLPVRQQTFLQVFRLNDDFWVSTPCDFSGELALDLNAFARARDFHCSVTSFNGDYIGYVIPGRYYHLGGYEARLLSFFGPTTPDYFVDLIHQLELSLWN